MNPSRLFTIALIFSCLACSTEKKTSDTEKSLLHLQLGTSYLMKGGYPQALRELLEAERLDPNNPTIQNNLGLAYLVREKMDEAEIRFKKALSLDLKYTDARNNLGRLYIDVGLLNKAITELETAARDLTYEQPEKSWANLGQAYFLSSQFEKAKIAFQNSLKDRKESCFTMNYYGRTLFELKQYKTAAQSLDQAIRLCENTKLDEPHFYSGLSFYKLGNIEQSRARFNELIILFPKSKYAEKANEILEIMK
jgi:type IV pilus assembly protein PilF